MQRRGHTIPARASRKGGRRACLCVDGSYKVECCDGSLIAQGIGQTIALTNLDMDYEIKHGDEAATGGNQLSVVYPVAFTDINTLFVEGRDTNGEFVELVVDAADLTGFSVTPAADCTVYFLAIQTLA